MLPKTRSKYEKEYKKAKRYFMVHENDPDLEPIKVPIPSDCPDIRTIDGYGKPAAEQKFIRSKVPARLIKLEQDIGDLEAIEEFLEKNQLDYQEEIEFIEREWDRRENGHWFYNNGVPTYVTGNHYLYISYWEIDIGIPDYRDRDRRFFIFLDFAEIDPVCLGVIYPKHRREGATHKAQCWMYDYVSQNPRSYAGIQSATEKHAKDVFRKHMVPGWKSLPFFFKPKFEGTTNPKSELSFDEPSVRVTQGKMISSKKNYLGSGIDYNSSDVKAYDSRKLHRYHGDEVGKTTEVDVNDRHGTVRECHMDGIKIIGMSLLTSTVEEMEKAGGKHMKKICDQSHYGHWDPKYKRNSNGETISGLYLLFMPAQDGLIVDEYGNSMIEESLKVMEAKRQAFIDADDFEGLSKYIRKYPSCYRECWRGDATNCKFNIKILEEQLDKFKFGNDKVVKGNFVWEHGVMGGVTTPGGSFQQGRVIFEPDPMGKFEVSYLFKDPGDSNQFYWDDELVYPANDSKFSGGSDPFKFKTTTSSNRSDGAGAVFMKRDFQIDPPDRDIKLWQTHRFVCTYQHRSRSKEEYGEDMLMMSIYYGFQMVTEINVDLIWDHFDRRGYHGYLYYQIDPATGRFKKRPGVYTTADVKEEIFREYQTLIEKHGHRQVHDKLLQQCYDIEDDMGPYDMFAAGGMSLLGAKSKFNFQEKEVEVDIGDYMHQFVYKK